MSTLLLSGWSQPVDALAGLVDDPILFDYSNYPDAEAAIEALKKLSPADAIGWSLGGQLLLRAMAAGAVAPRHVTLIGAPLQFISGDGVKGMDPLTYQLFRESYAKDPARTKGRFNGLVAKGDRDMRRVMEMLGHHPDVENTARWLPWLDMLASYRMNGSALASLPPALIIHGMNDAIVPFAQGELLVRTLPNAQLNGWADVGHAPHVHDAARVREEMAAHRMKHGVE